MEDGASGEMVAGGQGAPGRRGGGAKRGRRERESGGAMVPSGQQQGGGSASASRICRVKPNGGKDRHSKVVTVKGVRDRRVRLAVPTAIQFYDLQDRLGFDQPSKAVEWLINAASHAIDKLPPLDPAAFPAAAAAVEVQQAGSKGKGQLQVVQQGSSSTSETSKGSDLSLSRSDAARVAVAVAGGGSSSSRDKQKGVNVAATSAQAASFTELLAGNAIVAAASEHIQSWHRQQPGSAADCVGFAHPGNNKGAAQGAPPRFGNAPPLGMVPARPLPRVPAQPFDFTTSAGEITPFSFAQDVLAAASAPAPAPAPAPAGDYSLDFSMSSGFMGGGNSRGTLQSNSQSQYFSNQLQFHELDGPSPPFLYEHAAALAAHPSSENHRFTGTPPLQLWNGFRMEEKSQN